MRPIPFSEIGNLKFLNERNGTPEKCVSGSKPQGCLCISPSGEEGPTRRSSKCHATFDRRGGGWYTCRIFRWYHLPASPEGLIRTHP